MYITHIHTSMLYAHIYMYTTYIQLRTHKDLYTNSQTVTQCKNKTCIYTYTLIIHTPHTYKRLYTHT